MYKEGIFARTVARFYWQVIQSRRLSYFYLKTFYTIPKHKRMQKCIQMSYIQFPEICTESNKDDSNIINNK
jgi:hypothetical protein